MSQSRTPVLDEASLTTDQKAVFDKIKAGPRGRVEGPLRIWVQSPELADRAQALGQFARFDSSLPPDLSELAILVTARIWGSGFEWAQHAPIALRSGISQATVADIGKGQRPTDLPDLQQAVFDVAVALHRDHRIDDAVYAQAQKTLGTRALVDLVGICGYYTLISMTINAFDVPDGDGPTLPKADKHPHEMFR